MKIRELLAKAIKWAAPKVAEAIVREVRKKAGGKVQPGEWKRVEPKVEQPGGDGK